MVWNAAVARLNSNSRRWVQPSVPPQVAFNRLAPAPAQGFTDQSLHGRHGLRTRIVRMGIHADGHVTNHHLFVDGDAKAHVVDGFMGRPFSLAFDLEGLGFGVEQFALDVP